MNNLVKLGIVAALGIALVAVIIAKRSTAPMDNNAAEASGSSLCCPGAMANMDVKPATTQPAQAAVLPRLVDLGAGKCIPCKLMAPILEELKTELAGKLQVQFIDVWVNPEAGQPYGISVIPTQIFYDASGKELSRHEGFIAKQDILARFKEHGIDLSGTPAKVR